MSKAPVPTDRQTLALNPDRLFPADARVRDIARDIYESVRELALICPHGHVDPQVLLDNAPFPGPARACFSDAVVSADLRRLAGEQRADGGWEAGFDSFSPIAALEWRGYTTVKAVRILLANA